MLSTKKLIGAGSIVALSLLTIIATLLLVYGIVFSNSNQFSDQAKSFIHGKTDIPKNTDTVEFENKYYWHIGPFPSIILVPIVLTFGNIIEEWHGHLLLLLISVYLTFQIVKTYKLSILDTVFITFAFFISSMMIRIIILPISWHFAQLVAVTLQLAIILEMKKKNRLWLLGLLLSGIIATRVTAAGILLIIILNIFSKKNENSLHKFTNILTLFLPIGITMYLLLWFNYIRFGQMFINGYELSHVEPALASIRKLGLFSIHHILPSLYYYLVAPFNFIRNESGSIIFPYITYDLFGMSFALVAPFFLYSLRTLQTAYKTLLPYWIVIITTMAIFLPYFSRAGYMTYGPRYMADFLPLLLILVLESQKNRLTIFQKLLILVSAAFNLYMIVNKLLLFPYY